MRDGRHYFCPLVPRCTDVYSTQSIAFNNASFILSPVLPLAFVLSVTIKGVDECTPLSCYYPCVRAPCGSASCLLFAETCNLADHFQRSASVMHIVGGGPVKFAY